MQIKELVAKGSATYSNGRTVLYDTTDVASAVNFGKRAPYLARMIVEGTIVVDNASGGSITLGAAKLYDFLKTALFSTPEHDFIDCKLSAGQDLWIDSYNRKGKLPAVFTDTTIANSSSATFNVKLFVDGFDQRSRGVAAEDGFIWTELLRDSRVELTYGNGDAGGTFGAGVSIDSTSTLKVSFVLEPRDELRLPILWRLTEQQATSMVDNIPLNGIFPEDITIQAVHAAGVSDKKFSTSDFTSLTLNFDGNDVIKIVNPATVVALFNDLQIGNSGDQLAQFESGNCRLIPLWYLKASSGKRTKLPLLRSNPTFNFAGSLSSPSTNLRFLVRYMDPIAANYALKVADRTGISAKLGPSPLTKMKAKTSSKVGTTKTLKAMVMPIKFNLSPTAAAA